MMMRLLLALFFFFFQKLNAHESDVAPKTLFKHRDDSSTWELLTNNNSYQELHYHEIDSRKENICLKVYGKNRQLEETIDAYQRPYEKRVRYIYNEAGNLLQKIKADGVVLDYSWNEKGELTSLRSSDGTVNQTYDYADDYLCASSNNVTGKKTVFGLDEDTRTTKETFENGLTITGLYNEKGQRTTCILPDTTTIVYEYNHNLLQSVKRLASKETHEYTHTYHTYHENGQVSSSYLIAGLGLITYRYDEKKRRLGLASDYWGEQVVFDETGNVQEIHSKDSIGTTYQLYFYDSHQQLIHEHSLFEKTYGYDAKRNLIYSEGIEYTYNELYQIQNPSIVYDDNGNMTQNGKYHYFYDALDRLIAVETDSDKVVHQYDPFDRRITSLFYVKANDEWEQSDVRHYIYDGCREIGCANQQGQIIQLKILGVGLGEDVGAAIALELNGKVFAPIHDRNGSIVALIDAETGLTAETYRYSAFGEREIYDNDNKRVDNSSVGNEWGFRSKRQDREDLIFFGKRYYDPGLHYWLSKDPTGTIDSYNPYQFAMNNPLSHQDIYGLYSIGQFCADALTWTMHRFTQIEAFVENIDRVANPEGLSVMNYIKPEMESLCRSLLGNTFLLMMGFWKEPISTSSYGETEHSDKVRITSINGILNLRKHCMETAQLISRTHGGVRVHYIHRPTEGWARDLINCLTVKLGITSPAANQLAEKWKELIQEMGGTEGGGKIIHYAHSIGGTDTLMAKQYMTPEELQMIQVISFGSATIIPDRDFMSVTNYISWRDGVPYLDPFGYIHALAGKVGNAFFLGDAGIPIIDHGMVTGTYGNLMHELGTNFINQINESSCPKIPSSGMIPTYLSAPVAQPDRVPGYEPGG